MVTSYPVRRRCPSLFDLKHGIWTWFAVDERRGPSSVKTDIYGTIVYPTERNSDKIKPILIPFPMFKGYTPFVNRYRIIPSVSLSCNFDLNNNALPRESLIKICRKRANKQIFGAQSRMGWKNPRFRFSLPVSSLFFFFSSFPSSIPIVPKVELT